MSKRSLFVYYILYAVILSMVAAQGVAFSPAPVRAQTEWKESTVCASGVQNLSCARDRYGWLHCVYIQDGKLYHTSGNLAEGWLTELVTDNIDPEADISIHFDNVGGVGMVYYNRDGANMWASQDADKFVTGEVESSKEYKDYASDCGYQNTSDSPLNVFWLGSYRFHKQGDIGRGSMVPRQTGGTVALSLFDPATMSLIQQVELLAGQVGGDLALATDNQGYNHLAVGRLRDGGSLDLVYLTDKSGAWEELIVYSQEDVEPSECDLAVDLSGVAHLIFATTGEDQGVYYTKLLGGSTAWETPTSIAPGGSAVAVDTDTNGWAHLAYRNGSGQAEYQLLTPTGAAIHHILDTRQAGAVTKVAATSAGGAAVAYFLPQDGGQMIIKAHGDQD